MPSSLTNERVFIGPGLSPFKRIVTVLGVICLIAIVLWIAVYQHNMRNDASAIGSTIAALLFIGGFIYYLNLIAPVPFTIKVGPQGVLKRSRKGDVIDLHWEDLTRIKEEFFPNGKRISVIVYRKIMASDQKAKAWAVYRDDVANLDSLADTLKRAIPETCQWESETVHE
jgi:hypothetical protein